MYWCTWKPDTFPQWASMWMWNKVMEKCCADNLYITCDDVQCPNILPNFEHNIFLSTLISITTTSPLLMLKDFPITLLKHFAFLQHPDTWHQNSSPTKLKKTFPQNSNGLSHHFILFFPIFDTCIKSLSNDNIFTIKLMHGDISLFTLFPNIFSLIS